MYPNQNPYAQQGAVMSTPSYDTGEKRTRSRNPIILAIIIAIGLILAVIIISLAATKTGEVIAENTKNDLKELLEKHQKEVNMFESTYITVDSDVAIQTPMPSGDIEALKEENQLLQTNLEGVKTLREELKKYTNVKIKAADGTEIDLSEDIILLKKTLNSRMDYYEKYTQLYSAVNDVFINKGDGGSLTALRQLAEKENALPLYKDIDDFYTAMAQIQKYCSVDQNSDNCQKAIQQRLAATDKIVLEGTSFRDAMKQISSRNADRNSAGPDTIITKILSYYRNAEASE